MIGKTKSKDEKQALDRMVAEASLDVIEAAPTVFTPQFNQVIAEAIALAQKLTPPIPGDPAVQVAREDVQARKEIGLAKVEVDKAKLAAQAQERQQDAQVEGQALQVEEAGETQREALRQQSEDRRAAQDNAVKREIAGMQEEGDTLRNHEDNLTAIELAEMGARGGQDSNPNPGA